MPLTKITIREGKNEEFIRTLCDEIQNAVVKEANAPADSRFFIVNEVKPGRAFIHPSYGGASRSDDFVLIEIRMNTGRSVEVKKNLYRAITANLERALDIRSDDVIVSIDEVPKENWSFGKGKATYVN